MLRIDIDSGTRYGIPADNPFADGQGGAEEVWSYGLRNPWRWSFDFEERLLYIGDVGQGAWEVDVVPSGAAGLDFGWNDMEGSHCYEPSSDAPRPAGSFPWSSTTTVSVCPSSGYVVRGGSTAQEVYLYADLGAVCGHSVTGMAGHWVIGSGPTR